MSVLISTLIAAAVAAPPPAAIIDNERVTVWMLGSAEAAPALSGDSIAIALGPRPGGVTFTRHGSATHGDTAPRPEREVLIELKDRHVAPLANTSGYPSAFPRPHVKLVLENDRVAVWDYSWTPGEPTPMHFHDKDVVVTYLGNGPLRSTQPDGQTTVNQYSAGMVRFNLRDRTHTEQLEFGTQRAIIVELK